jgi:hypothetical protein
MNLFTTGQKNRMISAINLYRSNLINNCVPPTWDCIGGSACVDPATGNGQYSSLSDCLTACGVMPSWDCFPNLNPAIYSCVDPGNGNGQYASLNACNLECALNGFSEEVSSLLIYPNPAKNTLTIDGDYTSVTIYNVVGKVVLTTDHQKTIDVAVLGSGIYFIHVNTKNGMTVKKIIIE